MFAKALSHLGIRVKTDVFLCENIWFSFTYFILHIYVKPSQQQNIKCY